MKFKLMTALSLCSFALVGLCGCTTQTYTPPKLEPQIAPPAIAQEGVLTVGVDASNAPFATQVSGKIVGLDVDVAAAIADELGLSLQLKDVGSDVATALSGGEVDLVMGLDSSEENTKAWMSDPYIQTAVALFAQGTNSTIPTADSNPRIAAQSNSMSAYEVTKQFDAKNLVGANDLASAFNMLKDNQVSYVAADAVIGSYVAYSGHYDAHIVALMKNAAGYSVGIKKENTALQTAVKAALVKLNQGGVLHVIEAKWLGTQLDLKTFPLTAIARKNNDKPKADSSVAPQGASNNQSSNANSEGSNNGSGQGRSNHLNVPTNAGQPAS